jgi:AAA family ATP:ADP antiporter
MASVGGTLVLVLLMEVISHERKRKKELEAATRIMSDDEVQSGGGHWTKMSVTSVIDNDLSDQQDGADGDGSRIPVTIFKIVGLSYIGAFGLISFVLRYHHGFAEDGEAVPANTAWHILGYIQYITIESFGSIGVATFWSFANSTLTLNAAKTYYGFIIAMAQLGAIGGSTLATLPGMSIPNLFLLACVGIVAQIFVMETYGRRFPNVMDDDATIVESVIDQDSESELCARKNKVRRQRQVAVQIQDSSEEPLSSKVFLSGVYLIVKHNYLLLILGVSCLYEVSLTCLDYEMKLIGLDRFRTPPDLLADNSIVDSSMSEEATTAFAAFMGRYGQLTNLLSLFLSYYAFPYLMENYGLKHTLRIFPTMLLGITFISFVALPMNLPVLFISMSLLKALTYSINDPAKEILYIPTSNNIKFKAKFWIDVVGARVAKAVGSSINTYAGTPERVVKYGSLPSVMTAIALWAICYAAGIKFDELLNSGEIIGSDEDEVVKDTAFYENIGDGSGNGNDKGEAEDSFDERHEFDSDSQTGWESNVSIELVSKNSI